MSVENITKMYDELYKSQTGEITKAKDKALQELEAQKSERTKDFYNQENRVAQDNAATTQRMRDYMANRNLLNSGENVDAMLRNNTDLSNARGGIADARNSYLKGYDTNKLNINNGYNLDMNKLKAETEFKKKQEILAYQEKLRQEALEAQRIAASRSSSSSGGFGGSGEPEFSAPGEQASLLEVQAMLEQGQYGNVRNMMHNPKVKAYLVDKYGSGYLKDVDALYRRYGGTTYDFSFNPKRYARQSSMY